MKIKIFNNLAFGQIFESNGVTIAHKKPQPIRYRNKPNILEKFRKIQQLLQDKSVLQLTY